MPAPTTSTVDVKYSNGSSSFHMALTAAEVSGTGEVVSARGRLAAHDSEGT